MLRIGSICTVVEPTHDLVGMQGKVIGYVFDEPLVKFGPEYLPFVDRERISAGEILAQIISREDLRKDKDWSSKTHLFRQIRQDLLANSSSVR